MLKLIITNTSDLSAYSNGVVFFLPLDTRPASLPKFSHPKIKQFWHTGIIYKGKVYETFNHAKYSISPVEDKLKELIAQSGVFIKAPNLIEKKLVEDISSGTSCDEYVLRCLGISNRTGSDKGDKFPDDVYDILMGSV